MVNRARLIFNGRVVKEDGIFVVVVDGPNWTTGANSLDQALNDVPKMVTDTLQAYLQKGQLASYLSRFGLQGIPDVVDIEIRLDAREVIPALVEPAVESVTFPVAA